jgi:hypothetical protein
MKKLVIAVIHGIGSQDPEFSTTMQANINRQISAAGKNPEDVLWLPIFWADILAVKQQAYFARAQCDADLDFQRLRRFVISTLSDATAYSYRHCVAEQESVYDRIHQRIRAQLESALQGGASEQTPLLVMAHSLGGHIMSNYIWDQQKSMAGAGAFENFDTLVGLITFGCNIPLFTFAYDEVKAVEFPSPRLASELKPLAQWNNYYDADDVLAYPLKAISPSYADTVAADIAINVGSIFTAWNPASHTGYWNDSDFTKPAAKQILRFL